MRTQILNGPAALESLIARGMPDWQAKQVLATVRTYGVSSFPVNQLRGTMTVTYEDGRFVLGDFRLPK